MKRKIVSVSVALVLVMSLLPLVATPVSADPGPEAICVDWQPSNPSIPHYTYSGKQITLKGIARDAATTHYSWDFGDGSPAMAWTPIGNPYNLGVPHTYVGSVGDLFVATLRVSTDGATVAAQDTYLVRIYESTDLGIASHLDVRINIAIDEGLWYLHTHMVRGTYAGGAPGYGQPNGYWNNGGTDYDLAATGTAVDAFQLHGSRVNGDYDGDPYVETVQRAINYLLYYAYSYDIGVQTAGNPDTNGNGKGIVINWTSSVTNGRQTYVGGICMVALASSGAPNRVAALGRDNVFGRTYADIVQDMVDFFAWGQNDLEHGSARGGWRYYRNYGTSDMSTTQWPAMGMTAAEANMGSTVPQFVRDELLFYLDFCQRTTLDNDNGAFKYGDPNQLLYNITKTGAGIISHEFIGTPLTDPKVESAIGFVYRHWNDAGGGWDHTKLHGNSYGMYALMKSMRIPEPDITEVTEYNYNTGNQTANMFDWYYTPTGQAQQGLASYLVGAQQADGQWDDTVGPNAVYNDFSTGWGVLILLKGVTVIPPVAQICDSQEYDLNQAINLDGSCSYHPDVARSIVLYEWDLDDDGQFDDATGVTASIPGGFPAEGHYPIGLRVTDDNPGEKGGPQTDVHVIDVWVHPPCHDPHADANGPYFGSPGVPITLDASGSWDPDSVLLTYNWDLDNDGLFGADDNDTFGQPSDAVGINATFTWPAVYTGVVGVNVSDDGCSLNATFYTGWDVDYTTVQIGNQAPVSDPGGPYEGPTGATITLDGTGSSDPDGDPITYAWDLDNDGEFDDSTSPTPPFTVGSSTATVCLRVMDVHDAYDINCTSVGIAEPTGIEVGGDVFPASRLALLAPWLALAVVSG
jgi:hypothetical protein